MSTKYFKWLVFALSTFFVLLTFHAYAAQKSSLNWAGYVAKNGSYTAVGATWTVPDVRKNKNVKTDSAWVGIGGVNTPDLIQAGTQAITGVSGKVVYSAWYEMLPDYSHSIAMSISAGDSISVDISQTSKNNWKIELVNNTTNKRFSKLVHYVSALASAEWIEEMPSDGNYDLMPLDNFKSVAFSNAYTIDTGKNINIAKSKAMKVFMADKVGNIIAAPTALDLDGASFEVNRLGKNSSLLPPTVKGQQM